MPDGFSDQQSARRERVHDFRDPKKHFVRLNGWLPVVRTYAQRHDRRVDYLSLCGKEAIDVRYFAIKGVLYRNADKNHYPTLTFVESEPEDFAVVAESLGKVRLPVLGKFENVLLEPDHLQHQDLVASFPYHVLNLDFCGDIVPRNDHPYSGTLRCVDRVVELQRRSGAVEWHLFLTFKAQRAVTNEDANAQLCQVLEDNLEDQVLRNAYGERSLPPQLRDASYPEFLRIGVAKLLAHIARHHGFRCLMESSYVYERHQGAYHIVKLVAHFGKMQNDQDLPDPGRENEIYREEVRTTFGSQPLDVDQAIAPAAAEVARDLQPVLDELDQMGVVR